MQLFTKQSIYAKGTEDCQRMEKRRRVLVLGVVPILFIVAVVVSLL